MVILPVSSSLRSFKPPTQAVSSFPLAENAWFVPRRTNPVTHIMAIVCGCDLDSARSLGPREFALRWLDRASFRWRVRRDWSGATACEGRLTQPRAEPYSPGAVALGFSPPPRAQQGRPHRLAWPRTPPFHGGNRGSNPLGDTKLPRTAESVCRYLCHPRKGRDRCEPRRERRRTT